MLEKLDPLPKLDDELGVNPIETGQTRQEEIGINSDHEILERRTDCDPVAKVTSHTRSPLWVSHRILAPAPKPRTRTHTQTLRTLYVIAPLPLQEIMNDLVRQPRSIANGTLPTSNYATGPHVGNAAQGFHHLRFVDTHELTPHLVRGMDVRVVS